MMFAEVPAKKGEKTRKKDRKQNKEKHRGKVWYEVGYDRYVVRSFKISATAGEGE